MSYNIIRKVLIVIGDENLTGKNVRPITTDCSVDYINNIEERKSYCKVWDEINEEFTPFEINQEYNIIEPLFYNLKDNGFFIIYIPISNNESFLNLNIISDKLIGTKPHYNGLISKVKRYLHEYRKDQDIIEIPEISAIIYSGSIRNAIEDDVVKLYGNKIMTFMSNLNLFLPSIGLNNSFVFIDIVSNFFCSKVLFDSGDELTFKSLSKLKNTQRRLDENNDNLWKKYHALEIQEIKSDYVYPNLTLTINDELYEKPTGYYDLSGALHVENGLTGFIYGPEEIFILGSKISDLLYEDLLKLDVGLKGLDLQYYSYRGEFDNAYLFKKGKGTLTLEDFVGFDPEYELKDDASEEEKEKYNSFKEYKGEVVFTLEKYSKTVFRGKTNKDDSFTHLIFYNNIGNKKTFVAVVNFLSPQTFNNGENIKIKIRKEIDNIEYSKYIKYESSNTNYSEHSKSFGYEFNSSLDAELGLISSIEANNNAKIEVSSSEENARDFEDRSNRITTNKLLSGDSLFLVDKGYYRDRDNSLYSPYIYLPKKIFNKYTKINVDAKLGVYFWNVDENEKKLKLYLTTSEEKNIISFPLLQLDNDDFFDAYKNSLDKVRISYACGDLIVNFNGSVYKIQKTYDSYTCDKLYKNINGYIIFPAWYDLWNIAYVVQDTDVSFIDCSGEKIPLTSYKTLENHAYVENFPGPKGIDYKNITSTYLLGGIVLKELILQGIDVSSISVYDTAIISDTNEFKIDIYPLSYKYPEKTSIFKAGHNKEVLLEDLFLSNEGLGVKFKNKDSWYFSSFFHNLNENTIDFNNEGFKDSEKKWNYKSIIDHSDNKIRIVNSRGVRVAFSNSSENPNILL